MSNKQSDIDAAFAQRFYIERIPFVLGSSEWHGADCIGLLVLYFKHQGWDYSWEKNVPRRITSINTFDQLLRANQHEPDTQGYIGVKNYGRHAHLGLCYQGQFLTQDMSGNSVEPKITENITRYNWRN